MVSSIGMLFLTAGSLIYVITSKNRIVSFSNILVFVLLIIAFAFESALWTYSSTLFKNDDQELDDEKTIKIRNYLFGGQFIFQWTSLLVFTINYRIAEVEIRMVLDQKGVRHWYFFIWGLAFLFVFSAASVTFVMCHVFND